MGVSEIRGTLLGSLFEGNPTIWESISRAPFFRKPPYPEMKPSQLVLLLGSHTACTRMPGTKSCCGSALKFGGQAEVVRFPACDSEDEAGLEEGAGEQEPWI